MNFLPNIIVFAALVFNLADGRKCLSTCYESCGGICSGICDDGLLGLGGILSKLTGPPPGFTQVTCNNNLDSCLTLEFLALNPDTDQDETVTYPAGCLSEYQFDKEPVLDWRRGDTMKFFTCQSDFCNRAPGFRDSICGTACRGTVESLRQSFNESVVRGLVEGVDCVVDGLTEISFVDCSTLQQNCQTTTLDTLNCASLLNSNNDNDDNNQSFPFIAIGSSAFALIVIIALVVSRQFSNKAAIRKVESNILEPEPSSTNCENVQQQPQQQAEPRDDVCSCEDDEEIRRAIPVEEDDDFDVERKSVEGPVPLYFATVASEDDENSLI